MADEVEEFYKHHHGGSGAVIVVTAFDDRTSKHHMGIFGSAETAYEWRNSLPDHFTCLFSPYIVDDPDWGDETAERR